MELNRIQAKRAHKQLRRAASRFTQVQKKLSNSGYDGILTPAGMKVNVESLGGETQSYMKPSHSDVVYR